MCAGFHGGVGWVPRWNKEAMPHFQSKRKKPRSRERRTQIRFWVSSVQSVWNLVWVVEKLEVEEALAMVAMELQPREEERKWKLDSFLCSSYIQIWVCVLVEDETISRYMYFLNFNSVFFCWFKIDKLNFFLKLDADVVFFNIILFTTSVFTVSIVHFICYVSFFC